MNSRIVWTRLSLLLSVGALWVTLAVSMNAQVQTQTSTTSHTPEMTATVERAEVVIVQGNDLVVKMEDGSIRHIANVPESARVTVDGQELGIHDLKPGMKLQRTITTTTTPKTITTVKSVTGTVWHINPPTSVILTLEDGTNQQFNIPKDQKFSVDGQMVDAWGLKKGMKVSATKIVEEPITVVEQRKKLTGKMPPAPEPPPADVPILIATGTPPPPPAPASATAATPAELPKTGSLVPLIGMLGFLLLASAFMLKALRTKLGN